MGKGIRSPGRDIYSVNFADYLPETLKRDPKMKALAAAVTEQMLGVSGEIDNVLIYSRIDELPEPASSKAGHSEKQRKSP